MPLDPWLSGRVERRLPIIVAVRLAPCVPAGVDGEEKTYTDNVSPRGARMFSKHAWQPGDALRVTLLNGRSAFGNVVYCQRLPDDRYSIGVDFRDHPVTWSTTWKYGDE
ncbi:MAG TPA: PilZ domain-containing protein [Candidatus Angelobacter sp.]|nr:PilZ domain-containing protein [Candidatus Angelobacter sp.]